MVRFIASGQRDASFCDRDFFFFLDVRGVNLGSLAYMATLIRIATAGAPGKYGGQDIKQRRVTKDDLESVPEIVVVGFHIKSGLKNVKRLSHTQEPRPVHTNHYPLRRSAYGPCRRH